MLPDTSEQACRRILSPFHPQLWKIPAAALAHFRALPSADQLVFSRTKRAHRTIVWAYMMDVAERELTDVEGVRAFREFESTTYEFQGRILVRFKKLDAHGLSANYPTARAQSFVNSEQFELFDNPWSAPVRVDIGYVLDDTGLNARSILVVKRRGDEVEWMYEIERPADSVLPLPMAPIPSQPQTPTLIVARGDDEERRTTRNTGGR